MVNLGRAEMTCPIFRCLLPPALPAVTLGVTPGISLSHHPASSTMPRAESKPSKPAAPPCMATRSANATAHPGAIVAPKSRVKGAPTQAAVREKAKVLKEEKIKASVSRIAEIEGRNAAGELSNETPRATSLTKKRSYADAVSSGPESGDEDIGESAPLEASSPYQPSQLDNLCSETATMQDNSETEMDSPAFKPNVESVTEESSATESDTPPPPQPPQPKKRKIKSKVAKTALSEDDLDFHSPPPVKSKAVKQASPRKKRSMGDTDMSDVPPKKKVRAPQPKAEVELEPQTKGKGKGSKAKSRFHDAVKEHGYEVHVKKEVDGSEDERMVRIPHLLLQAIN